MSVERGAKSVVAFALTEDDIRRLACLRCELGEHPIGVAAEVSRVAGRTVTSGEIVRWRQISRIPS